MNVAGDLLIVPVPLRCTGVEIHVSGAMNGLQVGRQNMEAEWMVGIEKKEIRRLKQRDFGQEAAAGESSW